MSATAKLSVVSREGTGRTLAPAALACMGIVFGDIGTSPLYTFSVAVKSANPGRAGRPRKRCSASSR